MAGAAEHADCLLDIGPQAHPAKQANQGVENTLAPAGVRLGNHAIARVEEGSLMHTLLSTLAPLIHARNPCCHQAAHHQIHHHIEDSGGEQISLRQPVRSLERRPIIATRPCHHREPSPVWLEEPPRSGDHSVPLQDLQAPGPVQGVTWTIYIPLLVLSITSTHLGVYFWWGVFYPHFNTVTITVRI